MFSLLKKPYPAHDPSAKKNITISLAMGVFVGLFLFLFRPFGLHELTSSLKIFLILGYGVITFLVTVIFLYFIPNYLPKIQDERTWTVGKEILYMNILVIAIASCNTLYTPVLSPFNEINLISFLHMIANTFLVAIIPITFMVLYDHNQLLSKHVTDSESISLQDTQDIRLASPIIEIESSSESFQLQLDHFLYVESIGNYANIISHVNGEKDTKLFRSTMKNLESQIQSDDVVRCHRSYFINLRKVVDVKGNAQGFKLSLKDCDDIVPVSRKYVPIIKAYFAKSSENHSI